MSKSTDCKTLCILILLRCVMLLSTTRAGERFRNYSLTLTTGLSGAGGILANRNIWFKLFGPSVDGSAFIPTNWFVYNNGFESSNVTHTWDVQLTNVGDVQKMLILSQQQDALSIGRIAVDSSSFTFDPNVWIDYNENADGCSYVLVNFVNNSYVDHTDTYDVEGAICPYHITSSPSVMPTYLLTSTNEPDNTVGTSDTIRATKNSVTSAAEDADPDDTNENDKNKNKNNSEVLTIILMILVILLITALGLGIFYHFNEKHVRKQQNLVNVPRTQGTVGIASVSSQASVTQNSSDAGKNGMHEAQQVARVQQLEGSQSTQPEVKKVQNGAQDSRPAEQVYDYLEETSTNFNSARAAMEMAREEALLSHGKHGATETNGTVINIDNSLVHASNVGTPVSDMNVESAFGAINSSDDNNAELIQIEGSHIKSMSSILSDNDQVLGNINMWREWTVDQTVYWIEMELISNNFDNEMINSMCSQLKQNQINGKLLQEFKKDSQIFEMFKNSCKIMSFGIWALLKKSIDSLPVGK